MGKNGFNKRYGALSVLNQLIPYLFEALSKRFAGDLYLTVGWATKAFREKHGINKEHCADACCIACAGLKEFREPGLLGRAFAIRQFRCHDRQLIKAQTERTYWLDGQKAAANRNM